MIQLSVVNAFLFSLIGGIVLTLGVLLVTYRYNFGMDKPGPPKIHRKAIPRVGGLALYGAFMVGSLTNLLPADLLNRQILGVMVTVPIILGIGFLDDIISLKPSVKFVGQLSAAILATMGFEILIRYVNNPIGNRLEFGYELAILISVFWLLGVMNVTNLLDGVDGLATGVIAIFSFILLMVALTFQQRELSVLAAALLGSTLAFLFFNFSPAKIFMGDSGSLFLGMVVGELSILAGAKLATVMLILAIPIADTAYTIFRRLKAGRSLARRDTNHLHHRLMAIGLTQSQVCSVYYIVAGSFGFMTLIPIILLKIIAMLIAFLAYIGLLIFINWRLNLHRPIKDKSNDPASTK